MNRLNKDRIIALGLQKEAALIHDLPSKNQHALLNEDINTLLESVSLIKSRGYKTTPKTTSLLITSTIEKASEIRKAVVDAFGFHDTSPLWDFVKDADEKLANTLRYLFDDNLKTIHVDFYELIDKGYFKSAAVYWEYGRSYKDAWTTSENTTERLSEISLGSLVKQPRLSRSYQETDRLISKIISNIRHPHIYLDKTILNAAYRAIETGYIGTIEMLASHKLDFSSLRPDRVAMVYSSFEKGNHDISILRYLTKVGRLPRLVEADFYPGLFDAYLSMTIQGTSKEASEALMTPAPGLDNHKEAVRSPTLRRL